MKLELVGYLYERNKKGDVKRIRREGKIPGVLYGHKEQSKRIYVQERDFKKILEVLKKETVTIELKIDNESFPCLIKSIQQNPITGRLLHIDFQHISKKEKIKATIPIHLVGEAPGVKKGGLLDQHLYEVTIRCFIDRMPSHIDVDISNLELGKTIHLKDIMLPDVEFEAKPDTPVVSVLALKKVEAAKPAPEVPVEGAKEAAPKEEEVKEEKAPDKKEEK
ncbi:MAG: 50S ribosomal protein L25 [candidate division WOR-3 bacterium]